MAAVGVLGLLVRLFLAFPAYDTRRAALGERERPLAVLGWLLVAVSAAVVLLAGLTPVIVDNHPNRAPTTATAPPTSAGGPPGAPRPDAAAPQ